MPDITMCSGQGCPDKDKCKRYTSAPDPQWQSYFSEVPYGAFEIGKCHMFLANKLGEKKGKKK